MKLKTSYTSRDEIGTDLVLLILNEAGIELPLFEEAVQNPKNLSELLVHETYQAFDRTITAEEADEAAELDLCGMIRTAYDILSAEYLAKKIGIEDGDSDFLTEFTQSLNGLIFRFAKQDSAPEVPITEIPNISIKQVNEAVAKMIEHLERINRLRTTDEKGRGA